MTAGGHRDRWRHAPAVAVGLVALVPVVAMVAGSLRAPGQVPSRSLQLVPDEPGLEAYRRAGELVDLWGQLRSSVVVALVAVPLAVVVASWAGYAIARAPSPWRGVGIAASVLALMVPATALLVGRAWLYRTLGASDTYLPLVAPALLGTSPFYVLVYAWAFSRVPAELHDAARLEGLGPLGVWWRVAMPSVRPVTAAVAVLALVLTWGDLLGPLVYVTDPDRATLPVGLRQLAALDRTDESVLLAAAVVATLPVVAAFLLVHRRFLGAGRGPRWWSR